MTYLQFLFSLSILRCVVQLFLCSHCSPSLIAAPFFLACQLNSCFCVVYLLYVLSLSPSCFTLQNLHHLKQIQTLRQMNEQLLAENRALTRVVARLSQSTEPSESEEL